MRVLTNHKTLGVNDLIAIRVLDEPGYGNACHEYEIALTERDAHPQKISFQDGPFQPEQGPNGITNEALLAIVIDRLEGIQTGELATVENASALEECQMAMTSLTSMSWTWMQRIGKPKKV